MKSALDKLLEQITPLPLKVSNPYWNGNDWQCVIRSTFNCDNGTKTDAIIGLIEVTTSIHLGANFVGGENIKSQEPKNLALYLAHAANCLPKLVAAIERFEKFERDGYCSTNETGLSPRKQLSQALKLATELNSVTNRKPESQKTK